MKNYLVLILLLVSCNNSNSSKSSDKSVINNEVQKRTDSLVLASKSHINPNDTCEINEPDFKGYILPLTSETRRWNDSNLKFYRPSRLEVFKAEKLLQKYIDVVCQNTRAIDTTKGYACINFNKSLHDALKFHLKTYFRQYTAWIDRDKYVYFECLAPELQEARNIKKEWSMICDGGTILLHVTVDLDTGKVEVRDNGYG